MIRTFAISLMCLALSGCYGAHEPSPERPSEKPAWPTVVANEMAVPEGDCAYLEGSTPQKVSCMQAPLVKLLLAVNQGRDRWHIQYVFSSELCTLLVSGTWVNDVKKVADELARLPQVHVSPPEGGNGPFLSCRDDRHWVSIDVPIK